MNPEPDKMQREEDFKELAMEWEDRPDRIPNVIEQLKTIAAKLLEWGWQSISREDLDNAAIAYSRVCVSYECSQWLPFDVMSDWESGLYCVLMDEERWADWRKENKPCYELAEIIREERTTPPAPAPAQSEGSSMKCHDCRWPINRCTCHDPKGKRAPASRGEAAQRGETPRTDANTYGGKGIIGAGYVSADFARALELELAQRTAELAEARKLAEQRRKDYLDVADAICRESCSPQDLAHQAREIRNERDSLQSALAESQGEEQRLDELAKAHAKTVVAVGAALGISMNVREQDLLDSITQLRADLAESRLENERQSVALTVVESLRADLEEARSERDQAITEASRCNDKWMSGIEEITNCKIEWHPGQKGSSASPSLSDFIDGLRAQLTAAQAQIAVVSAALQKLDAIYRNELDEPATRPDWLQQALSLSCGAELLAEGGAK